MVHIKIFIFFSQEKHKGIGKYMGGQVKEDKANNQTTFLIGIRK